MESVIDIASLIVSLLVWKCPKDTWNLVNTIGYIISDNDTVDVLIGGVYAPYAPYTNEPWVNRKGKNPNEGWIELVLTQVGGLLAEKELGVLVSNV